MIHRFLQYKQANPPIIMAARRRFSQGGGHKDADAESKPAGSSREDGEVGEPIIGLKVFVIVVEADRISEKTKEE